MKAADILEAAQGHMLDRASTYDKPEGERSMGATVAAFNAVTGDGQMNTEERGWLFMVLLKAVRSQQGGLKLDNYEDGAAYFGLMGEAAHKQRAEVVQQDHHPMTPNVISWPTDDARIDVIGQNAPTGEHYAATDPRSLKFWAKAPLGATHWRPEGGGYIGLWLRYDDMKGYFEFWHCENGWVFHASPKNINASIYPRPSIAKALEVS